MKKRLLFFSISFILCGSLYYVQSNYHHYEVGDRDTFNLEVGETITIKIPVNGSTGYQNCWINQHRSKGLQLVKENYYPSWLALMGLIGVGGTDHLTFKATQAGIDTIKIARCPTGRMQKDCDYFSSDTMRIREGDTMPEYSTDDYLFIVKITE